MLKLVIAGSGGRMGRRIATLALQDSVFTVAGALEAPGHPTLSQDYGVVLGLQPLGVMITSNAEATMGLGDAVIDFSSPEATAKHVDIARRLRKPIVIGTTGLSDAQQQAVRAAAAEIPIVFSPNMSLGVNLLFELVRTAAAKLGLAYDAEVVEAHHKAKQDAPSGTAKRIAEVLASSRQQPVPQIPVHAIRAGDIVGDHTVILAGPYERLELTHRAHGREAFATGALRAAQFVAGQRPGLYDMSHVLQRRP